MKKTTTHSLVKRVQKMSNEEKEDLHTIIRLLTEFQEIVYYEDDYTCMYEIVESIDEIDSGIAESINQYLKRFLELSENHIWKGWEPLTAEAQAAVDECDQMQRGEFI